jgi:hypothetical protein
MIASGIFILTRFRVLCVTHETGFGLDDWIYWYLMHRTRNCSQLQRRRWSTQFAVHRYIQTRVLSLHKSYPGNGCITAPLSLQITHEVFSQPNSFLAIFLRLPFPKTQFNWSKLSWRRENENWVLCLFLGGEHRISVLHQLVLTSWFVMTISGIRFIFRDESHCLNIKMINH